MKKFVEVIEWYGVLAILVAYALNNFSVLSVSSVWYLVLNSTGSLGILYGAYRKKDYQPVVLNLAWLLIALIGIIRIFI